ncbi:hypothetical protein TNCV_226341 [Trichonephila clavipes]|nr:hypothetical protein TNCV_226341 [Trichonephila clavipes]
MSDCWQQWFRESAFSRKLRSNYVRDTTDRENRRMVVDLRILRRDNIIGDDTGVAIQTELNAQILTDQVQLACSSTPQTDIR